MILSILFWFLKKYLIPPGRLDKVRQDANKMFQRFYKRTLLVIIFFMTMMIASAQEKTLEYEVTYKGENIGSMQLYQKKWGNNMYMKIVSSVKMRFIFNVTVLTNEESVFKNGRLIYSKVNRNVNGKENANKQTQVNGDVYQTSSGGRKVGINNTLIDYNLHMLYSYEPENIDRVYSDNFQQFLLIRKVAAHRYKIELPDGNYNYYSFENGTCSKVDVHHSLYSIQIKLKPNR